MAPAGPSWLRPCARHTATRPTPVRPSRVRARTCRPGRAAWRKSFETPGSKSREVGARWGGGPVYFRALLVPVHVRTRVSRSDTYERRSSSWARFPRRAVRTAGAYGEAGPARPGPRAVRAVRRGRTPFNTCCVDVWYSFGRE